MKSYKIFRSRILFWIGLMITRRAAPCIYSWIKIENSKDDERNKTNFLKQNEVWACVCVRLFKIEVGTRKRSWSNQKKPVSKLSQVWGIHTQRCRNRKEPAMKEVIIFYTGAEATVLRGAANTYYLRGLRQLFMLTLLEKPCQH